MNTREPIDARDPLNTGEPLNPREPLTSRDPLNPNEPLTPREPSNPPLPAWSEAPAQQPAWPDSSPPQNPSPGQQVWPETSQPDAAWSNLASPAPWPPSAPPQPDQQPQSPPKGDPMDRTITYNDAYPTPAPSTGPPSGPPSHEDPAGARPGSNLSRDPSDPDRPFVTAGQISGSRTPPPERQQELWNTVFGDNYQEMGEEKEQLDEPGNKPVWLFALAGSVAIALVGALLWAFLAGPLASDSAEPSDPPAAKPTGSTKPTPAKTSTSIGALKKFPGKAAPVLGVVPDPQAGISVPRLGGTWLLDQRPVVRTTYGYDTRQYVKVGVDEYANLMTGPLPQRLSSSFASKDDLEPVIKQVVLSARKRFFPPDNKVRKIAQQPLKIGGATAGRLIAYELTSGTGKATIVAAAINTANELPSIVYMSVPGDAKQLLPDINTVIKQLKVTNPA